LEAQRGLPWEKLVRIAAEEEDPMRWGGPEDFYLLFYLEGNGGIPTQQLPYRDGSGKLTVERVPCLTEDEIRLASVISNGDRHDVQVQLTDFGTKVLAHVTRKNLKKRMAMVVGGFILSAPVIQSPITGGKASITGDFTRAQAQEIADNLNAYREECKEFLQAVKENRSLSE
jgi:hypothetical protein